MLSNAISLARSQSIEFASAITVFLYLGFRFAEAM